MAPARLPLRSNASPKQVVFSNLLLKQQLPIMNEGMPLLDMMFTWLTVNDGSDQLSQLPWAV